MHSNRFDNIDDNNREVFFYLGLLSPLFAKMESKLLDILGKFISPNHIIGIKLFESNNLFKNTELLKEINQYIDFETDSVNTLLKRISKIRKSRNLFIHGVWSDPIKLENDVSILITESKLEFSTETKNGRLISKIWKFPKSTELKLSSLKTLLNEIEEIVKLEDILLNKLEDYDYNEILF